ncbi:MAG: nitrilase, partial [Saprospiraceae bacterium]|nr:nitrilase [Saprospiraceae bacterium]
MGENIKVATAQFENRSGDKEYNLGVIESITKSAASQGAKLIAFHECSITGYTFARHLTREEMVDLAEPIPEGPSIAVLQQIAAENDIAVFAGLFEKDAENNLYKAYVGVDAHGLLAKYRKIHP